MSVISEISPYAVSDFLEWKREGRLEIAPKFQRRTVWTEKAQSYLIDSIVRGMPIPPLYIRFKVDTDTQRVTREVVDGQQRLRTVFGFIDGRVTIKKVHNEDFAGMTYEDLPSHKQTDFLNYSFSVNVLRNVSDQQVLQIFSRINTYAVPLKAQELRNARFFGAFKQTAYELAHEHYQFWTNNRVLRDKQIARMREAQLVSEIIMAMREGFTPTKKKDIDDYYEKYDDELPHSDEIKKQFRSVIDEINRIFEDGFGDTAYRRLTMFYSLFILIYDAMYGLPGSDHPTVSLSSENREQLREELIDLSDIIYMDEPPEDYREFLDATRRATADPGRRVTRHEYLWRCLERALEANDR